MAKKPKVPADQNPAPPHLSIPAVERYVSAFEAPRAANRRLLAILVLLTVSVFALAIAIMSMLPLHQRVPYFVKVNQANGQVTVDHGPATQFTPTQTTERYFLRQWVENLLTIGPDTANQGLPASYAMLRGSALGEWKHFVFTNWKPLARLKKNPALHVYPTIDAIGFLGQGQAVVRVSLHDSSGQFGKHLMVTIRYSIIAPTTNAQVDRNPIGLWITHFEVTHVAASH